ncbi:MAG: Imm1 family immunity protein [Singulisphaera sp.]
MSVEAENESMAYPVTVDWQEDGDGVVVGSPEELSRLLDRIAAETEPSIPILVMVTNNGGSLAIGVGAPASTLNHTPTSGDPPYMISVGDFFKEEGFIDFWYLGHHTQFCARNAIPIEQAKAAVLQYAETGTLPDEVAWEEV